MENDQRRASRDDVQRAIAERIVEGCRVRRKNLAQLGADSGIAPSLIGRYARVGGVMPSPAALAEIAEALGVTVGWLAAGEGDGPSSSEAA